MSEYSYNNEPIDLRTMVGLNQHLFDPHLQSPGDKQDQDEGNTELKFGVNDIPELTKQMALIEKIAAQLGVQVPNQPLSHGSADQVPIPGLLSPDPIPAENLSTPTMYTNIPAFEQPGFAPHLTNNLGRTAGQIPAYIPGVEHEIPISEPSPKKGSWEKVLECLKESAELEMAGVAIYSFFAEVLNGVKGKVLAELFKENAAESLDHYAQVTHWMLRVQGGRRYVTAQPSTAEMADVPFLADMSGKNYTEKLCKLFLDRAIAHESKAIETYLQLLELVKGMDVALENWAMNQVQIETQDLVQFKEWAGEL